MTTTGGSRWLGLFIPAACLVALLSHDPVRSVGGRVVDTDDRPLSGVAVTLRSHGSNRSTTVITDRAGAYRLQTIDPGLYRVDAILAGYDIESEDSLSVSASEPVELDLRGTRADDPMYGATSAQYLALLPDGEEKRRFILDCTGCHQFSAQTVMSPQGNGVKSEAEWLQRTDQMLSFAGPYTSFPIISRYREADATAVWLSQHLEGAAPAPPSPIASHTSPPAVVMTAFDFPRSFDLPHDLAIDADGRIVITGMFSHAMWLLDPASGVFEQVAIPVPNANPRAVTLDEDGNWLVLLGNPRKIARYTPAAGAWTMFDIPVYPHSIVYEPAGAVWYNGHFTENPTLYERLDLTTGSVERHTLDPAPGMDGSPIPYEIRRGPDGMIWGSELAGNRLVRIDPGSGEIGVWDLPTSHSGPRRLDVDRAGMVWIPEYAGNALTRFDPATESFQRFPLPTADALPYIARVHHASGRIWVAEAGADAIALFDPATERFVEYPLPDRETLIRHIAVDQETGAVWAAYGHAPARSPKIVRVELVE